MERVLAVALLGAAPARVAGEVGVRRAHDQARRGRTSALEEVPRLGRFLRGHAPHQLRVPRCSETVGLGELRRRRGVAAAPVARAALRDAVVALDVRRALHAEPRHRGARAPGSRSSRRASSEPMRSLTRSSAGRSGSWNGYSYRAVWAVAAAVDDATTKKQTGRDLFIRACAGRYLRRGRRVNDATSLGPVRRRRQEERREREASASIRRQFNAYPVSSQSQRILWEHRCSTAMLWQTVRLGRCSRRSPSTGITHQASNGKARSHGESRASSCCVAALASTVAVWWLMGAGAPHLRAQSDPSVTGEWSAVQTWPDISVHASLLPTGKVIFYPYTDNPRLWDPSTGSIVAAAQAGFNIFCTGLTLLADGRLFVGGGHIGNNVGLNYASIYDPETEHMDAPAGHERRTVVSNDDHACRRKRAGRLG